MSEVKITDLAAATSIDGSELFVASQNGNPVKITTDQIGYKYTSVINMDSLFPLSTGYYTLETAIAAVPSAMRKVGCEICFNDGNEFLFYKFLYNDINNFTDYTFWNKIYNINDISTKSYTSSTATYLKNGNVLNITGSGLIIINIDYPIKSDYSYFSVEYKTSIGNSIMASISEMEGGTSLIEHSIISDGTAVSTEKRGYFIINKDNLNDSINSFTFVIKATVGDYITINSLFFNNDEFLYDALNYGYSNTKESVLNSIESQRIREYDIDKLRDMSLLISEKTDSSDMKEYIESCENLFPNQSLYPYPFVNGSPVDYEYSDSVLHIKQIGVAQSYLMPYYELSIGKNLKRIFASIKYQINNSKVATNFSDEAYMQLWIIVFYADSTNESICMKSISDFYTQRTGTITSDVSIPSDKEISSIHYRLVFNMLQNITDDIGIYLSEPTLIATDDIDKFDLFLSRNIEYFSSLFRGSLYGVNSYHANNSDKLLSSYPYLSGKKAVFLGDSITVQEEWEPLLSGLTGIKYSSEEIYPGIDSHSPTALGGSTIRAIYYNDDSITSNTAPGCKEASIYYRADSVRYYDPDIIFVFGGTNDMDYLDGLGSSSDAAYTGDEIDTRVVTEVTSQPTFYACYKGILKKLSEQCPTARIICLTTLKHDYYNVSSGITSNNERKVIRDAIIDCAIEYGCQVIDLYSLCSINEYNASSYYKADNTDEVFQSGGARVHPNSYGGERIASVISNYLK